MGADGSGSLRYVFRMKDRDTFEVFERGYKTAEVSAEDLMKYFLNQEELPKHFHPTEDPF